jgi:hypothetical protein
VALAASLAGGRVAASCATPHGPQRGWPPLATVDVERLERMLDAAAVRHRRHTTAGVRTRIAPKLAAARPQPSVAATARLALPRLHLSPPHQPRASRERPPLSATAAHRCHRHRRSPPLAATRRRSPRTHLSRSAISAHAAHHVPPPAPPTMPPPAPFTRAAPFSARRPPCRPLPAATALAPLPPEVSSWLSPSLPPVVSLPASRHSCYSLYYM